MTKNVTFADESLPETNTTDQQPETPLIEEDELYDPNLDDQDAIWVSENLTANTSDATLLCPCCLLAVCYDCQRHETYKTQYRAMFVTNTRIKKDQILKTDGMQYHPVECRSCLTEVAVFDDDVYHFFNVVAEKPVRNKTTLQ